MRIAMTLKLLLTVALVVLGAFVAWSAIASGAGPYKEKAVFEGNGKECGTEKKTGCTFNSKTTKPLEFRLTIGGKEVRVECQEENTGTGWNPPGEMPQQNDSIDSLKLTECKVQGFGSCKVTPEIKGLPWVTKATREGPGGAFADQVVVPKEGLRFKFEGACPVAAGTYGVSGELNASTIVANEPFCEPKTYVNCTYDKFEGKGSGTLTAEKEEKEAGTAIVVGEFFIYCTGGGACTEKANQIKLF
jgi:hypothetical protein